MVTARFAQLVKPCCGLILALFVVACGKAPQSSEGPLVIVTLQGATDTVHTFETFDDRDNSQVEITSETATPAIEYPPLLSLENSNQLASNQAKDTPLLVGWLQTFPRILLIVLIVVSLIAITYITKSLIQLLQLEKANRVIVLSPAAKEHPGGSSVPNDKDAKKPLVPKREARDQRNLKKDSQRHRVKVSPNRSIRLQKLGSKEILPLEPWTYEVKSEDRSFSGMLAGKYPCVILADGVSETVVNGQPIRGGGGQAAELACTSVQAYLNESLQTARSVEDATSSLNTAFERVNRELWLKLNNGVDADSLPGSTMLLTAFLFLSGDMHNWIYGYIGTGRIITINPNHLERNFPVETVLLDSSLTTSPTKTLPGKGLNHIVATVMYRPGDILYAATDGFDEIASSLAREKRISLGTHLWMTILQENIRIDKNLLLDDEYLGTSNSRDDASLGVIWTS